jgi:hypothetical protein
VREFLRENCVLLAASLVPAALIVGIVVLRDRRGRPNGD